MQAICATQPLRATGRGQLPLRPQSAHYELPVQAEKARDLARNVSQAERRPAAGLLVMGERRCRQSTKSGPSTRSTAENFQLVQKWRGQPLSCRYSVPGALSYGVRSDKCKPTA